MPFWPFTKRKPESLTAEELRDRLIKTAASGSRSSLRALCQTYKEQVAANVDLMCKAPAGAKLDSASIESYVQCLGAVAECLAKDCDAPQLWNKLCGTPESNPLLRWEQWHGDLPKRAQRLEHDSLIAEARQFITESKSLEGRAARQNEAFLQGRLGELLFHSGHVTEAIEPFHAALSLCREINDCEGQRVHLTNLLEAHRYLGNVPEAIHFGEQGIKLANEQGFNCEDLKKQVHQMQRGEPRCRVVMVRGGKEFELDEFSPLAEGRYEFQFRRNRLPLQMATVLVQQGNALATSGKLADALDKYQEAMEVDPHNPDPVYQSGACLLELGAYGKAREAFEEIDQLAPGWFQCRFDRWLAASLETGEVADDEFRLSRRLQDGGLSPEDAMPIALQAIGDYPHFAAFHLFLGDIYRDQGDKEKAISCYRRGLELVSDPDLETRFLCAIAGTLPVESPERPELVKRAVSLQGNLVAQAMAVFIPLK